MGASSLRTPAGSGERTFSGGPRYRFAVAGLLVLAVMLFGGASRADEIAQVPVRLAAIAVLAASLWPLDGSVLRAHRGLLLFALACCALLAIQLVPLPRSLWASLPGHAPYAEVATATGTGGWRPWSLTPGLTVNALQALLVPGAALVATLYCDAKARKRIALGFGLVAVASALLGLAQLAAGSDGLRLFARTSEGAPVGLFANRNHQAALLACALPLAAAVIPARGGWRARNLVMLPFAGAALVVTAVLFLTGSRMGVVLWVGALVGTGWTLHVRGLLHVPAGRGATLAWAAGALAVAGVAVLLLAGGETFGRFRTETLAADTRWAALPSLAATAGAFLPLGAGFGSFDSVYRRLEPDALLSTIYLNQAHNEPLQLLIEGGLPAVALLAVFLGWWLRTAWRLVRHGGRPPRRGLPDAALAASALLMIASLADYPLRTPLLAALFAFCCAEMAIAARRRNGTEERT